MTLQNKDDEAFERGAGPSFPHDEVSSRCRTVGLFPLLMSIINKRTGAVYTAAVSSSLSRAGLNFGGGFERAFDGGIVVAIAFATHGHLGAQFPQSLLIVVRAILATPVHVLNAPRRQVSKGDRPVQSL